MLHAIAHLLNHGHALPNRMGRASRAGTLQASVLFFKPPSTGTSAQFTATSQGGRERGNVNTAGN